MNKKLSTCLASMFIAFASLAQADDFTLVDANLNGFVHIRQSTPDQKPEDLYISRSQIRRVSAFELDPEKHPQPAAVRVTVGESKGMVHTYYFPNYAKAKAFAERIVEGA